MTSTAAELSVLCDVWARKWIAWIISLFTLSTMHTQNNLHLHYNIFQMKFTCVICSWVCSGALIEAHIQRTTLYFLFVYDMKYIFERREKVFISATICVNDLFSINNVEQTKKNYLFYMLHSGKSPLTRCINVLFHLIYQFVVDWSLKTMIKSRPCITYICKS